MSDDTVILKVSPIVFGPCAGAALERNDETVSGFVLDAVIETCEQSASGIIEVRDRPTLAAQSMVGVITYCYTKGVLGAAEIEQGLWKDDTLRSKCAAQIPTARTISRFRRMNRTLIQTCLENALRRIRRALASCTLSQPLAGGADTNPKPARPFAVAPAPGEGTTILIRKEAAQRVENATYLDSELSNE